MPIGGIDAPYNDTATFMEWAKSRARFALSPLPLLDNAEMTATGAADYPVIGLKGEK